MGLLARSRCPGEGYRQPSVFIGSVPCILSSSRALLCVQRASLSDQQTNRRTLGKRRRSGDGTAATDHVSAQQAQPALVTFGCEDVAKRNSDSKWHPRTQARMNRFGADHTCSTLISSCISAVYPPLALARRCLCRAGCRIQ